MNAFVEAAALEQQHAEPSPLARARIHRKLTVEEAAKRAGLTPEEVGRIEEGASTASARTKRRRSRCCCTRPRSGSLAARPDGSQISVDVLNGGGDITYTRRLADRIGSMAYQIKRVSCAGRFDYPETAVYFPPGGEGIGRRLAQQLGVDARPLPAGKNPRRLVVIAVPRALW
jgi:DNA-binding XRE family transcriptional regulator